LPLFILDCNDYDGGGHGRHDDDDDDGDDGEYE
jgi:hypothetical protein